MIYATALMAATSRILRSCFNYKIRAKYRLISHYDELDINKDAILASRYKLYAYASATSQLYEYGLL